jgi:protein TonB
MAYADARDTKHYLGTAAVVAALEAGLAVALIAGLSYTFVPRPEARDPVVTNVPIEKPKPKEPVKPRTDTKQVVKQQHVVRDPVIVGPAPQAFTAEKEVIGGGEGVGVVAFPAPTPSPVPSFTPVKARPRGNPASWISELDYPSSELRAERQGRSVFRLSLDASGKVTACSITASSGSPVLDATACEKLTRRARFEPAVDSTGARTEGYYVGSVNWRLPEG